MTDAYAYAGPLGNSPRAFSNAMTPALCGSLTFHSQGYIVSVCPSVGRPAAGSRDRPGQPRGARHLRHADGARSAGDAASTRTTPAAATSSSTTRTASGAPRRRATSSCSRSSHDGRSITKVGDYDLTGVLEDDERITSALPDFKGRIWFVSKKNGKVGILNPRTRRIRVKRLGEDIQNSFAVGRNGVYIVSSARMYRFSARKGRPRIVWKRRYGNSGHRQARPGRRRLGHHADAHERRLRRDHRQRRPDERRRLPPEHRPRPLPRPRLRARGERHGELADGLQARALRGEQLRLPGPVRPQLGRAHHARLRPCRRHEERLPQGVGDRTPSARPPSSPSCRPPPA